MSKFKERGWKQEVQIVEIKYSSLQDKKPIAGYIFSNGRKFDDKVEKKKSYD